MILDKIKSNVLMVVAGILAITLLVVSGLLVQAKLSAAAFEVTVSEERQKAAEKVAELTEALRTKEAAIASKYEKTIHKSNEDLKSLAISRDNLLKRLRNATSSQRTANNSVTDNAKVTEGVVRQELLGSFGEEDVSEANRADTIRIHLQACYEQYDNVRNTLMQQSPP